MSRRGHIDISSVKFLDYIESTGTQYIDTLVKATECFGIKLIYQSPTLQSGYPPIISSALDNFTLANYSNYGTYLRYRGSDVYRSWPRNTNVNTCVLMNGVASYTGGPNKTISTLSLGSDNNNIHIFHSATGGRFGKYRLIHLEMYADQQGNLLRLYKPAFIGRPGLLDIINSDFYTNAGAGEFLYN